MLAKRGEGQLSLFNFDVGRKENRPPTKGGTSASKLLCSVFSHPAKTAPGRLSVGEITCGFAAPGYSITENECGFAATYLVGVWPFSTHAAMRADVGFRGIAEVGGQDDKVASTDERERATVLPTLSPFLPIRFRFKSISDIV